MKAVSKTLKWIISVLLLAYLLLIVLLHVPYVQTLVGQWTAHTLSRLLGTEVSVGRVNLGLLNRVIVDNVSVDDQQGRSLADVRRVAVTVDMGALLGGEIQINTAQVFGLTAHLSRTTAQAPLNCQFLIDSLSNDQPEADKSPLRLRIHSLILRHCNVDYDVWDAPLSPDTLSLSHLQLRNIALTAEIHIDETDSLREVQLRRLDFSERRSGFRLDGLQATAQMRGSRLRLDGLDLRLPHSRLTIDQARWNGQRLRLLQADLRLAPADLAPIVPLLRDFPETLTLAAPRIEADSVSLSAPSLQLATADDSVRLGLKGLFARREGGTLHTLNVADLRATAKPQSLPRLLQPFRLPDQAHELLERAGDVALTASLDYHGREGDAEGELRTDAGTLAFDLLAAPDRSASANLTAHLDLSQLLGEKSGGVGLFVGKAQLAKDAGSHYSLQAAIDSVAYKGQTIEHLTAQADYDVHKTLTAQLQVLDDQARLTAEATWEQPHQHLVAHVRAVHINPHALALTDGLKDKTFAFALHTDVTGSSLSDLLGEVVVDSLEMRSPDDVTSVAHLALSASPTPEGRHLTANGDFIEGSLDLSPDNYIHRSSFDLRLRDVPVHLALQGSVDSLLTQVQWHVDGKVDIRGDLAACVSLDPRSLSPRSVSVRPSAVSLDDTLWAIAPSQIAIDGSRVAIDHFSLSNGTRYLRLDGVLSQQPSDSLVCTLEDMDLAYVLSLVDFHAVEFGGQAFGQATVRRQNGDLRFGAQLRVDNFTLNDGRLGTAYILAGQDEATGGIRVNANIPDKDDYGLSRLTVCNGYIAPAKDDIHLTILAKNTNVEFLNGFLKSTFRDIKGSTNGTLEVVGPLSEINLQGNMATDVSLTLRPTGVRYHVSPSDTLRFRPFRFLFNDVTITDTLGRSGTVNGFVSHRNMKDFGYDFRFRVKDMLLYEEKEWNSDKFKGTIFSTGSIRVQGSDGHPLHITADITPTRGSYFAYDAATPDAITASNFITFHDRAARLEADSLSSDSLRAEAASLHDDEEEYTGDIFMDANIHMNPQCELRLRMDQANEAYISALGSGNLQAHYYNKGPFTLDGTYNIDNGRYRLFLQDIIYRDLLLQRGSNVVFNGNPFDADIHLICHHTLQAVPITDLLGNSSSLGSTSRVRVICVLDITGHLGNMAFNFDLQLPNVNDEVRSIVRSLISTDEEMNRQIIYLLGLGRFYTAEYALASGGDNTSTNAMNSLLSSTLSGQINQMLEGVMGQDSRWNFGTGLSTGEQGWEDLDVEGILSGHLLDDRLLINGNFGYRNNTLTQNASFIGDFDVKWRLREGGNTYLKAYNRANDRYFTKATLNTQGIGISYQKDFETWRQLFRRSRAQSQLRKDTTGVATGSSASTDIQPEAR